MKISIPARFSHEIRRSKVAVSAAVGISLLVPVTSQADVLVIGAPSVALSELDDVKDHIDGTGLVSGTVDTYNAGIDTPSAAFLAEYNALLVFPDAEFDDAALLGSRVADFVDDGGGVVVSTFSFHLNFGLDGRFRSGHYSPFTYGGQNQSPLTERTLGEIHVENHPILNGVESFSGGEASFHNTIDMGINAVRVADWSHGVPLVGTLETFPGRIAGLNFFPVSENENDLFWDTSTDGDLLLANAVSWVSVPEPASAVLLGLAGLAMFRRSRTDCGG